MIQLSKLPEGEPVTKKLVAGRVYKSMTLTRKGDTVKLKFPYSKTVIEEVKQMENARWNPEGKFWTIAASQHNDFQLSFLLGTNPYAPYDAEIPVITSDRPLREHQIEIAGHMASRPGSIAACEMGTGKSLSWIVATEYLISLGFCNPTPKDIWYIGPVAGVRAVNRELKKWNATFTCRMITYDGMKKLLKEWEGGSPPKIVCFDESSKLKHKMAQRSQAARHLADNMREVWGTECRVILMTGTPAPKSPMDWWWQCMIAQPGFIREGKENKFRERLAVMQKRENAYGGSYNEIVTWRDSELKCNNCGKHKNDPIHAFINCNEPDFCSFTPMTNEVAYLNERMKGLVLVKFKKDCTDLPDKQYEIVTLKPSTEMIRASRLIRKISPRAITALINLRELSDGFQYSEVKVGKRECPNCRGTGKYVTLVPKTDVDPMAPQQIRDEDFQREEIVCPGCDGSGEIDDYKRSQEYVTTPKDDYFIEDLDENEEIGRYIVFAGFTATLDKLVILAHQQGWATLKVDGKGYVATLADGTSVDVDDFLDAMDQSHPRFEELRHKYPKICFVGHPIAAGMALTLTASPITLYYSNDFSGEARMQSEDRFHRLGMDPNKGATIKDLILLPSDKLVLNNLKEKKKLQNLTMGQLEDAFTKSDS